MNREHATNGFKVVANTSATPAAFYGFTVTSAAVLTTLVAPTTRGPENVAYSADTSGIAGPSLPAGYYPIRGSSITLASGTVILWLE